MKIYLIVMFSLLVGLSFSVGCRKYKTLFPDFVGLENKECFSPNLPELSAQNGVIFWQDFENSPLGPYLMEQLKKEWLPLVGFSPESFAHARIDRSGCANLGNVLTIFFQEGEYGTGVYWEFQLPERYEELYVSYCFRFGTNFRFVRGGKLPGLAGGTANTGGDIPTGRDGWSARIMWRKKGRLVHYVYHPDQPGKWGEDFPFQFYAIPGCWYQVETHIRMNSPGKKDGLIESWIDGKKVASFGGIRFRDVPDLGIDKFLVSVFFGGNDPSWAAQRNEMIQFDWFVFSEQPISH